MYICEYVFRQDESARLYGILEGQKYANDIWQASRARGYYVATAGTLTEDAIRKTKGIRNVKWIKKTKGIRAVK